ncbi:sulfite exporter TauE/SafE family protein [Falsirhodobacter halotolerans]|uniref:sulfite exporter TauE/SafE family protein n=1 Tax=Falsirhodobacter halotolerans TaxID=1146892 RepID=UPI001FD45074|nr:sulfite exporter TauE/SafE family protein [Falsirhodobacter halotolerans]MCJ8138487.1 sulfite exporter TauE/SafE family protein [Falsirhodobacter halotolerans]
MDQIFGLPAEAFWAAMVVTVFAGVVKGAIGFAMPLVMMSLFTAFLPPEYALAGLILPVLSTNIHQSLREGLRPALQAGRSVWRFILVTVIFIFVSAPFAADIPPVLFLLLLGVPVTLYAGLQLAGVPLGFALRHQRRAEWGLGIVAGLYGGISGIWGPPLIIYLLSTDIPKSLNMRIQGVVFLMGGVVLLVAHLTTGVLGGERLLFSAALIPAAFLGMIWGYRIHDRLDQARFRRWTQVLLVITGLNLIRQAVM